MDALHVVIAHKLQTAANPIRLRKLQSAELPLVFAPSRKTAFKPLSEDILSFREFGQATRTLETFYQDSHGQRHSVGTYVNEFWTARQRQASSLHEVSYRACFKPQLPRFFIDRLTQPGDVIYDPFMGRGTTPVEAALLGRVPFGNDVNPLSVMMTRPRLSPPFLDDVAFALRKINFSAKAALPQELLAFYHPETLRQIVALRTYLLSREKQKQLDSVEEWIRLVALNRLTGHSPGFFSVYTLPPNQAVSVKSQRKINLDRNQAPPRRDVASLILKKSRQLLKDCDSPARTALASVASSSTLLTHPAAQTPEIPDDSVSLVVTSPPFLNVVQYAEDNWLRCWFVGIQADSVKLTIPRKLEDWKAAMTEVFHELHRVLKPGGHVAFEVGEIHVGKTKLEEAVLPCGVAAGLEPLLVLINDQKFTKTANCWGVDNNFKGTNTNRIVVFQKQK